MIFITLSQVAQFLLDDAILNGSASKCHIICTQPRRISAISVSCYISSFDMMICVLSINYIVPIDYIRVCFVKLQLSLVVLGQHLDG